MADILEFDETFDEELFLHNVGKRIRELEKRFANRQAAADTVGCAKSTFQSWGDGHRDPSFKAMARYSLATGTSLDELAFGANTTPHTNAETVDIPMFKHRLKGDIGNWLTHENIDGYVPVSVSFAREILGGVDLKKLAMARVFGDSMEPTIMRGDTLFIDLSVTQILDNALYAMQWEDALVIKRIQRRPEGIVIISDNVKYENQTLNPEKADRLNIMGVVKTMVKLI
jgi:SOS-response transcriptional repressor LexA